MRGPIDYIVVGFEQPKFEGRVIEELEKAVDAGIIEVLALMLVEKTEDGTVRELAVDADEVSFRSFDPLGGSLVDDEDIEEVGSLLEPGSAAGFIVIEHLWAVGLKQAIIDAGGSLLSEGRIHPDAADELEEV